MGADGCLFAMLVTKMDEFVSSRYIGAGQAVHSGQLARSKSAELRAGIRKSLTASLPKSTGQNGPLKGVKGERLAQ